MRGLIGVGGVSDAVRGRGVAADPGWTPGVPGRDRPPVGHLHHRRTWRGVAGSRDRQHHVPGDGDRASHHHRDLEPSHRAGSITISATGTSTCSPLVAPGEGFTYAVTLTMGPSTTVRDTSRIIEVGMVPGSDSLTFTNPGGWVTAIQTGI